MTFISLEFALFFLIVVIVYLTIPHRWRWSLLVIASYVFCATWNVHFALILAVSTVGNFVAGKAIDHAQEDRKRKRYLLLGIVFNLVLLFVFKYFNFFVESLTSAAALLNIHYVPTLVRVILPVGISYYTFQELAYLLDIYRKRLKPEPNLGIYAAFVAFFPHLTAGPIARAGHLLPQFYQRVTFEPARVVEGLRLILWGLFSKVVVADNLGVFVDRVYNQPRAYGGFALSVATFFFAIQIYCDFAGYSGIAIGTARILGFRLMDNFRQPYFAQSFQEFWQRWHISLSTWIRDYLFFPLTRSLLRSRAGRFPRFIQLIVSVFVMGLVGLWHGASWSLLAWGVLHGIFLGIEGFLRRQTPGWRPRFKLSGHSLRLIRIIITFVAVSWTWIFFRASSFTDAWYITTHLSLTALHPLQELIAAFGPNILRDFGVIGILIGAIIGADALNETWGISQALDRMPAWSRWALYYALLACVFWLGFWGKADFLYFQF
jgi:alginate O-acetyltransferase complex protein AlgI